MYEQLGRYRLLKLLATGGMGEVFLARQEGPAGFTKNVVIKRILRHLAQDQGFIDLFLNEAKLAGQLQHPNIAQVFGLEHEGNTWFIAMEYVHGRSLRDLFQQARKRDLKLPPRLVVRMVSHALQGLHYAHELTDERGRPLGILHRDVTPENLLVGFGGGVKVVDFGIARAMTGETRTGRPKGKVSYMAPELTMSGATIDRRADLYSMGVVLFEALTLERPPNAPSTVEEALAARIPYTPDPRLADGLNQVLERAMAPDPAQRFETAQAMSEALEGWLATQGQAVLPGDLADFMVELFGRQTADLNPSVVALEELDEDVGNTERIVAFRGTQPIVTGKVAPLAASSGSLQRVPSTPLPPARSQLVMAIAIGGGTVLLVGFVMLLAVWPRANGTPALELAPSQTIPVAEVGPHDRMMPELVLDAPEPARPPPSSAPKSPPAPSPAPPRPPAPTRPTPTKTAETPKPPSRPKRPKPGRVTVRVNPWAEVIYGGKSYGITPLPPIEVASGTAVFTLRNKQLKVTRKVSVKVPPGGAVVLKADLFKP